MSILELKVEGADNIRNMGIIFSAPRLLQLVLRNTMTGVRDEWKRLAMEGLNTSRAEYVAAIKPIRIQGAVVSIALEGEFANMIENGADAYQLQDFLLRGKKSRVIRFFHSGPTSSGRAGMPMGTQFAPKSPKSRSARRSFSSFDEALKLGRKINRAAKRAAKAGHPLRQSTVTAMGVPQLQDRHATDPFAGMVKEPGQTAKTFRTMTDDLETWRHPGIEAHNFVEKVQQYAEDVFVSSFESLVGEVFG